MKIKEVIDKTGLTDRAIRLYIDEGLVLPNIEEILQRKKEYRLFRGGCQQTKQYCLAYTRKRGLGMPLLCRHTGKWGVGKRELLVFDICI